MDIIEKKDHFPLLLKIKIPISSKVISVPEKNAYSYDTVRKDLCKVHKDEYDEYMRKQSLAYFGVKDSV